MRVEVNGFVDEVVVDTHLVDDLLVPRLATLATGRTTGRRRFAFLAAPPGTGKSTLAAVLAQRAGRLDLQTVGIDGFHHPQRYLDSHSLPTPAGPVPLSAIKGAPETFDVHSLARSLAESVDHDVWWPAYDRTRHDVVPAQTLIEAGVVLVEGNWLLLDEPEWDRLSDHSSLNVFIDAQPELLRDRLVDRKVRGGLTPEAAAEFYKRSDRLTVERVLHGTDRRKVDLLLHLNPDGSIDRGEAP